ncbi:hypothetical protein [Kitasatospora sp. NPDC059571]|uniref:hypothetical protein n=1 Tax=Kitasatospora sp. NPDC059571 TaxID=3346871 RepID=UPI0036B668DD
MEATVDAWERDELGGLAPESHEQYMLRDRAAEPALIGLAITQRGRGEGEEVVIDLDVAAGASQ